MAALRPGNARIGDRASAADHQRSGAHHRKKQDQVQVLDARRQGEWEEGHIEGALLRLPNQLARAMDDLDPRARLRSTVRAAIAVPWQPACCAARAFAR
jgi:rhodanese-related sulfurtransferase